MWHHNLNPFHLARKNKKEYDYIAYTATALSFIFGIPQVIHIYTAKSAQDLILVTWLGSLTIGIFWLLYGIGKKARPVIVSSLVHLAISSLMINGIIQFQNNIFI
jgi:uncharacterized protein with PQ loop repeat